MASTLLNLALAALAYHAGTAIQAETGQASHLDELWRNGRRVECIERMLVELESRSGDTGFRLQLAQRELAVHRYRRALVHVEGLPEGAARAIRAQAHYLLGDYEGALRYLDPELPDELELILRSLQRLGQTVEADERIAAARATFGAENPVWLTLEGQRLARSGEHGLAAKSFEQALAADPWNAEALFGLGQALTRSGEGDAGLHALEEHRRLAPLLDALDFAQRGLDLAPAHGPGHAALGDALRSLGRADAALAAYERGLALATRDEITPIALRVARLHTEDRSDLDSALGCLERGIAGGGDVRLRVRRGDLLLGAGRASEAVREFQRALETKPQDTAIAQRLARARAAEATGR